MIVALIVISSPAWSRAFYTQRQMRLYSQEERDYCAEADTLLLRASPIGTVINNETCLQERARSRAPASLPLEKKRDIPRLITPKKFPFEREATEPQPKVAEAADPPAQAARPAAQERAPPAHEPDHAATIDLRSVAQLSMSLAAVFLAIRARPLIDWTLSRAIPAARSSDFLGLFRSLSQNAIDLVTRLTAFLQGSRLAPKAVGIAGGLVAYFFLSHAA